MSENIEYYINKGMDFDMAEYFSNGRRSIVDVKPNIDFTLTLTFDNGELRIYDCHDLLEDGSVFEFLKDYENFSRVYLDEDNIVSWDRDPNVDSSKVWNNKVDLSSDTLYVKSIPQNINVNSVIDTLIQIRQESGLTQEDLGKITNLTQSVIARFESKKVIPRLDTFLKIADALNCEFKIINKNETK